MNRISTTFSRVLQSMIRIASAALLAAAAAACLSSSTASAQARDVALQEQAVEPAPLAAPLTELAIVEDLSEEVANRFIDFSYAVQKRDFASALEYLTEDFQGHDLNELGAGKAQSAAAGAQSMLFDALPVERRILARAGFVEAIAELVAPLDSIEFVFLKTRGAEFETAASVENATRGLVRQTFNVIGRRAGNRPYAINCWLHGEVVRQAGAWRLRRLFLDKALVTERDAPCFTEVAGGVGIAHRLPQLKHQGSSNFYWRGAATADFDGDGRFDIFVSSSERNFLYRNSGEGTFVDATEAAGLKGQGGITGPLFFDYDNDGDPDLFCASVGWEEDGVPRGQPLRLYRNDGGGQFRDVSNASGIESWRVGFSATSADIDNDGWLDLYLCCYNRLDAVYPNSWHKATNGKPNALFRNKGDGTFEEIAHRAGVAGTSWSYAAAFADYDEDGDQDLYVANDYGEKNLFRNRGDGTFEDIAGAAGVLDVGNGMGTAWGDLNSDGSLDLYVSNMASSAGNRILNRLMKREAGKVSDTLFKLAAGNTIFHQKGDRFELLPSAAGGIAASWAWGVAVQDFNLDGFLDVYVANGFISGDSLKDT